MEACRQWHQSSHNIIHMPTIVSWTIYRRWWNNGATASTVCCFRRSQWWYSCGGCKWKLRCWQPKQQYQCSSAGSNYWSFVRLHKLTLRITTSTHRRNYCRLSLRLSYLQTGNYRLSLRSQETKIGNCVHSLGSYNIAIKTHLVYQPSNRRIIIIFRQTIGLLLLRLLRHLQLIHSTDSCEIDYKQ